MLLALSIVSPVSVWLFTIAIDLHRNVLNVASFNLPAANAKTVLIPFLTFLIWRSRTLPM